MSEKKITEQEFNDAMNKVMQEMVDDPRLENTAKLIVPMSGMTFAIKMKSILFREEN